MEEEPPAPLPSPSPSFVTTVAYSMAWLNEHIDRNCVSDVVDRNRHPGRQRTSKARLSSWAASTPWSFGRSPASTGCSISPSHPPTSLPALQCPPSSLTKWWRMPEDLTVWFLRRQKITASSACASPGADRATTISTYPSIISLVAAPIIVDRSSPYLIRCSHHRLPPWLQLPSSIIAAPTFLVLDQNNIWSSCALKKI